MMIPAPLKALARRILRGRALAGLRGRSAPLDAAALAPALVVAPHPDDESFGCGALIARLAASRAGVTIVFVTDGEASHRGHPRVPPTELGRMRRAEALAAAAAAGLGPKSVRFLGAPDGRLSTLSAQERETWSLELAAVLRETAPAAVLTPCRDDGSSEHEGCFGLLRAALAAAARPVRVIEFPVWSQWSPRLLQRVAARPGRVWRAETAPFADTKRAMAAAYRSQNEPLAPDRKPALPPGFASAFDQPEEFFLESPL